MKKLTLLFTIITFIGCCSNRILLDNGFTKKIKSFKEYSITTKYDSLGNMKMDTLTLSKKTYNYNGLANSLTHIMFFSDESINVDFFYNDKNKLEKRVFNYSNGSSPLVIKYLYENSLLNKTLTQKIDDTHKYITIKEYEYNKFDKLEKTLSKTLYIDTKKNDTIINYIEIDEYDKVKIKTKLRNLTNSERNETTKYYYKCGLLNKIKKINSKNSLKSVTKYKYEFDRFNNWIRLESFENGKPSLIRTRIIQYK